VSNQSEEIAMTLTDFLLARIAEDEADARDAYYDGQRWIPEEEAVVAADRDLDPIMFLDRKRDAYHAANWSPARVLAECEAKRKIVLRATYYASVAPVDPDEWHFTLRDLAAIYADHPDYREEWRP
jgi:Family of unknown function (DUF6221)